jgi:Icc-related predicted phosphoesterase
MILGALADIHGNFDAMTRAIERHRDVAYWICVGDLANRAGEYPEPPAPIYWIKGNNENFDRIAEWEAGAPQPRNLQYIRNGTAVDVSTSRVAGVGGTFAPTWFNTPAADLPHVRPSDDKRRHFVREEVEACKQLRGVDILMTHEAARPFILADVGRPGGRPRRLDAGKPAINELLATLQPRLHLCGHHHRFVETEREGVRSVCIDRVNRSYLLIDTATWQYEKIDQ